MEVCAEEQSLKRGRMSMFFGRVEDGYRQEPGDREERIQQADAHGKAQCECAAGRQNQMALTMKNMMSAHMKTNGTA